MLNEMRKTWGNATSGLITAALISAFGRFGGVLLSSTHVYLVEQAVCRQHYMLYDMGKIHTNGLVDEEMCKLPEIEARVASIYGIYCSLWYLPSKLCLKVRPKALVFFNPEKISPLPRGTIRENWQSTRKTSRYFHESNELRCCCVILRRHM
jgi:hypothetical protein